MERPAARHGSLRSIEIGRMFDLLEHLKSEYRELAEVGSRLTSQHLQDCFKKRRINPIKSFPEFFSTDKAVIVLSYRWKQSFSLIGEYFSDSCVFEFNRTHQGVCDPIPTSRTNDGTDPEWDNSLDPAVANMRLWIDILFNDQLVDEGGMAQVLSLSEEEYKGAQPHLVLYDDELFRRCWCLAELVFRNEAKRTSGLLQLTTGRSEERAAELEEAEWDYYNRMEASVPSDLVRIRRRIDAAYGDAAAFNRAVHSLRRVMTARLARSTPVDACFALLRLLSRRICDEGIERVHGGPQSVGPVQITNYLIRQGIDLRTEFSEYFSRAQPALFVTAPILMSFGEVEGFFAPQCIAAYNARFAGDAGGGGHRLLPTDRRQVTICLDCMFQPYNLYKSWDEFIKADHTLDYCEKDRKVREAPVHCGLAHTDLLEVENFIYDLCERRKVGGQTGLLESERRGEDPALDLRLGPAAPRPFLDLETSRHREMFEEDIVRAFGSVEACRAAVDDMRRRLGPPSVAPAGVRILMSTDSTRPCCCALS